MPTRASSGKGGSLDVQKVAETSRTACGPKHAKDERYRLPQQLGLRQARSYTRRGIYCGKIEPSASAQSLKSLSSFIRMARE